MSNVMSVFCRKCSYNNFCYKYYKVITLQGVKKKNARFKLFSFNFFQQQPIEILLILLQIVCDQQSWKDIRLKKGMSLLKVFTNSPVLSLRDYYLKDLLNSPITERTSQLQVKEPARYLQLIWQYKRVRNFFSNIDDEEIETEHDIDGSNVLFQVV